MKPHSTTLLVFALLAASVGAAPVHTPELSRYCDATRKELSVDALDPATVTTRGDLSAAIISPDSERRFLDAARDLGLRGAVVLGTVISAAGKVLHVKVLQTSRQRPLDDEALRLMMIAEFTPARLRGTPTAICMRLPVVFTDHDTGATRRIHGEVGR